MDIYEALYTTRAMRRVFYCGEWIQSHSLHIHLLAAPDFLGYESGIHMAADHREVVERGFADPRYGRSGQHGVRDVRVDGFGALTLQGTGRVAQRTGGIDHVVHHDAVHAFALTDNIHDLGLVRLLAAFVDDDQVGVTKALGQRSGANHAANIR